MLLKQVGSDNGDKGFHGNVHNLKLGEYRYYPQDNPNLKFAEIKHITRADFIIKLKQLFPNYIASPFDRCSSPDIDKTYYIGSVGVMKIIDGEEMYNPVVINKGYICFEEATKTKNGTVYYIHNDIGFVYEEAYKDS